MLFYINMGSWFGGDFGLGVWVIYGFGFENENLFFYVVMMEFVLF